MKKVILLRFGEIYLKGKNRGYFEKVLISNIKLNLKGIDYKFYRTMGRYIIADYDEMDEGMIINKLTKVFGLVSLSKAVELETDIANIKNYISSLKPQINTFRVSVTRADKTFPIQSNVFERELWSIILKINPNLKVK